MFERGSVRARRRFTSLVVVAVAACLVPQTAMQSSAAPARPGLRPATPELIERAVRRGELSEARGALYLTWAFTAPSRLPEAYVSETPWSGTLPLLRLRERLLALGDAPAAVAARIELRGRTFACPGTSGSLPQTKSTSHFYVQYRASALQALSIGQYATALETTWKTEIGRFGWAKPPPDPVSYPPGRRYPVRIENLGTGLYGYVAGTRLAHDNPSTPWNDRDAVATCMVLNRNFGPFPGTPLDALRATAAHEFNHSIQFGYGALAGAVRASDVMVEGLATQMEDEVFDSSNDSYYYLWPDLATPMGRYTKSPYPYWVVFRAMAERFGSGERNGSEAVYQAFWEQIGKGNATNLAALAKAFKSEHTTLAESYHGAAIALRFLADCSPTPRKYCLDEGPAYEVTAGPNDDHATLGAAPDSLSRTIPNDFALNWIGLPTAAGTDLTVTHDRGKGVLRVGVACLAGDAVSVRPIGTATRSDAAARSGLDLSGCDAASAVISNVKMTAATPTSITRTDYTIATG
ncbi:MAG TPA: hypothetical protein VFI59_08115 [Actinomycetota bacterium]|nr:hypothetical protein [Actinomycetota bacterium]